MSFDAQLRIHWCPCTESVGHNPLWQAFCLGTGTVVTPRRGPPTKLLQDSARMEGAQAGLLALAPLSSMGTSSPTTPAHQAGSSVRPRRASRVRPGFYPPRQSLPHPCHKSRISGRVHDEILVAGTIDEARPCLAIPRRGSMPRECSSQRWVALTEGQARRDPRTDHDSSIRIRTQQVPGENPPPVTSPLWRSRLRACPRVSMHGAR